jgi:hypothetical protein
MFGSPHRRSDTGNFSLCHRQLYEVTRAGERIIIIMLAISLWRWAWHTRTTLIGSSRFIRSRPSLSRQTNRLHKFTNHSTRFGRFTARSPKRFISGSLN